MLKTVVTVPANFNTSGACAASPASTSRFPVALASATLAALIVSSLLVPHTAQVAFAHPAPKTDPPKADDDDGKLYSCHKNADCIGDLCDREGRDGRRGECAGREEAE